MIKQATALDHLRQLMREWPNDSRPSHWEVCSCLSDEEFLDLYEYVEAQND